MIGLLGTMGIDCPIAQAGVTIKAHVITKLPMKTEMKMNLDTMKHEVIVHNYKQVRLNVTKCFYIK